MSDLSRFLDYARAFEIACLTDDFAVIAPFFAPEAIHEVCASEPFAADDRGREAVVSGLRASVHAIDRRFNARIPEILEGPVVRDDGIWMRFGLRLRRGGLPDVHLEGEHLVSMGPDGAIERIDEKLLGGCDEAARDFLIEHAADLRPAGSPFAAPGAEDAVLLRDALARTLVRAYGQAKSRQDTVAALSACHPSFRIETIPFGTESRDRDDTADQLALFFSVFPDYRADTRGLAASADGVAWWGDVSLTFAGSLLGLEPTGRSATLPACSLFELRDGMLVKERFFFDLGSLCEAIGVSVEDLRTRLASLRAASAAA